MKGKSWLVLFIQGLNIQLTFEDKWREGVAKSMERVARVYWCLIIWIPKSIVVGGATTDKVALLITHLALANIWFLIEILDEKSGGRRSVYSAGHKRRMNYFVG